MGLFSYSPIFAFNNKFSGCRYRAQMISSSARIETGITWNRTESKWFRIIFNVRITPQTETEFHNIHYVWYLLRTVSGIVRRQTPFRNSMKCLLMPLRIGISLRYHSTYGCGSHCTMHSKRAVCPLTTAISFSG